MIATAIKIKRNLIIIIILTVCLAFITCVKSFAKESSNIHKINLNEGKPVVDEHIKNFKPGDTLTRYFTIENLSTDIAYYTLYFDDITGSLKDILEVTIYDGEKIILSGILNEHTIDKLKEKDAILASKEKKTLTAVFHFPKAGGNYFKSSDVYFDLNARAGWAKN